ncbi:MAG: HEPN domain-containing protein [Candidatus Hydrogenedentes bacterium]|nr:HEPN domain-containing protein [Candidatus Hydrogenedentota bacterium]
MKFDWSNYLVLARALVGQESKPAEREAQFRAAVSRAYYAAFCSARNYLRDRDPDVPDSGEAHIYVQNAFEQDDAENRRRIGNVLRRLRISRRKADYDDQFPGVEHECTVSIRRADQILGWLRQL